MKPWTPVGELALSCSTAILLADGFDMHGDYGAGWWIAMMLGMLVFWGLVIGAIDLEEYRERKAVLTGEQPPGEAAGV